MTDDLRAVLRGLLGERDLPDEVWHRLDTAPAAGADGDPVAAAVRALAEIVNERDRDLRWHQTELDQTNAGLLALHAEIDQQRRRTSFLEEITRAAATSLDSTQLLDEVIALVVSHGFADTASVWTLGENGLVCPAEPGREPDETTRTVVRTRRATPSGTDRVSAALTVGPHLLGVFELRRFEGVFSADDVDLVNSIADRVAVGLRNANEYEREHELAERLQRAMLPTLASLGDLGLVARYLSATSGVHVGGDWYDAVARPDGTVVLSVGDVTGHGVDAAVVMGQLQNALRAYALEGHGPATSLRLAHNLLRGLNTSLYATAVVVEMEPATGLIRWANAGHPPPLLRETTGTVRYLEAEHAPMLGIHLPPRLLFPEHELKLTPGSSLALFTDGLIERRTSDLDTGLNRLLEAFRSGGAEGLDTCAEHVIRRMLGTTEHDDDVCLLLCHWAG